MPSPKSIPRYDLLVSLDRSDRTAALAWFDFATGAFLAETIFDLAPESLDHGGARSAPRTRRRGSRSFEQPSFVHLLYIPPISVSA